MKTQWSFILMLLFALLIAVFAVVNVDSVNVDYVFGASQIPLILVILGSALVGGLMVGLFGILRQYKLHRKVKALQTELALAKADPLLPLGDVIGVHNGSHHETTIKGNELEQTVDHTKIGEKHNEK